MTQKNRQSIIFSISHLYLFWTTGFYYLWELSKKYNVILIADETLKKERDFNRICETINLKDILFLPLIKNPFQRHRIYSKQLKLIAEKYRPFMVLQHNYIYSHNIYLFYWAKKMNNKCIRGVYLNGQLRKTSSELSFKEIRDANIEGTFKNLLFIKNIIKYMVNSVVWINNILNNYILPKIFTGSGFKIFNYLKHIKPFVLPKENQFPSSQLLDFYLTYYPFEKEMCDEQFKNININVIQISHPLETCEESCQNALVQLKGYELKEKEIVLILPGAIGFSDTEQARRSLDNWIKAIKLLVMKFPGYQFLLKLHPRTQYNPVSKTVNEKITANIPEIIILEPKETAEKWIIKSKVIVGDVSTTLWWANYFHSKIVISFDMHDFTGSEDMMYYEGIYYFSELDDFRIFDISSKIIEEKRVVIDRKKLPTLTEVIDNYHNIYENIC